jgi:putative spermidine/putrescine transport system permease protein
VGLVVPGLLLLAFVVGIPLVLTIRATLGTGIGPTVSGFTGHNYAEFFTSSIYLRTLENTAIVAALAAFISLFFGYPLALYMAFGRDRARKYLALGVISPLVVSGVVRADGLTFLYSPGNPIDRFLSLFPGNLSLNLLNTQAGVVLGLAYYGLPFIVITLASSLSSVDQRTLFAARSLGASTFTVIRRVVLPLSIQGILAGFLLVFSMATTSLVLPILLGGANFQMVLVQMYQQIFLLLNWSFGFTMGIILLVFSAITFYIAGKLGGRGPAGVS